MVCLLTPLLDQRHIKAQIGIVLGRNGALASSFRWRVAGICMLAEARPQVTCGWWCSRQLEKGRAAGDESPWRKSLTQIPQRRSSLEATASLVDSTSTRGAGGRRP